MFAISPSLHGSWYDDILYHYTWTRALPLMLRNSTTATRIRVEHHGSEILSQHNPGPLAAENLLHISFMWWSRGNHTVPVRRKMDYVNLDDA